MMDTAELTRALIRIESTNPGRAEAGVLDFVKKYLQDSGAELREYPVFPGRSNLLASLPGEQDCPALIYVCHMDTVVIGEGWRVDPLGAEIREGKIFGRGACDMKSGLACALNAFRECCSQVKEGSLRLRYPLKLLCTVDEEGEMNGIQKAISDGLVKENDWILDTEPTDGCIQMAHKGRLWIVLDVDGVTAHASRPERGVDAIAAAAEILSSFRRKFMRLNEGLEQETSSVTFGQIEGGYQPYVVPDHCRVWIDIRLLPPMTDEKVFSLLDQAIREAGQTVRGMKARYQVTGNRPYIPENEHSPLLRTLQDVCGEVTGKRAELSLFPGYTDTAVIAGQLNNKNCLSYGPGSLAMAHKPDEYVPLEDIRRCSQVLLRLILEISRKAAMEKKLC